MTTTITTATAMKATTKDEPVLLPSYSLPLPYHQTKHIHTQSVYDHTRRKSQAYALTDTHISGCLNDHVMYNLFQNKVKEINRTKRKQKMSTDAM